MYYLEETTIKTLVKICVTLLLKNHTIVCKIKREDEILMQIITLAIFIAIAANLDNLGVGIAYGMQKIKISHMANTIIAVISFITTWLSAQIGKNISLYLSTDIASIIGVALLFSVGIWVLVQPVIAAIKMKQSIMDLQLFGTRLYIGPAEILNNPEKVDIDDSKDICPWEALLLGIALSINAIASGFDAGTTGLSPLLIATIVAIISFLTISMGCDWGRKYASAQLGKYATAFSGILLILLACHQLLG
jgi:putative sporulation protein YtaF